MSATAAYISFAAWGFAVHLAAPSSGARNQRLRYAVSVAPSRCPRSSRNICAHRSGSRFGAGVPVSSITRFVVCGSPHCLEPLRGLALVAGRFVQHNHIERPGAYLLRFWMNLSSSQQRFSRLMVYVGVGLDAAAIRCFGSPRILEILR